MARLITSNIECPVCQSRDSGALYQNKDKNGGEDFFVFKCFSGNHPHPTNAYRVIEKDNYMEEVLNKHNKVKTPTPSSGPAHKDTTPLGLLEPGMYIDLEDETHPWGRRGIDAETMRFYGVTVRKDVLVSRKPEKQVEYRQNHGTDKADALIFPYHSSTKGELIAQKVRTPVDKKGSFYKSNENAISLSGFFGQQLFQSGIYSDIAITFGELDAMATYQMLKIPTVSVTNGDQSAYKQFQQEYAWLSRFRNIYLIPDNDDSCRAVIPSLGMLFPKKIKIVNLSKHKDACDYLKEGDVQLFRREFATPSTFSPEKILSLRDLKPLLFEEPPKPIATYPWEGLNTLTGGIWPGELITIKAQPKQGKTSLLAAIASHLKETTDYPMGIIFLEETQRDLVYRFVSLKMRRNLQRQDILETTPKEAIEEAMDEIIMDDKIFILDHWGSCSSDFLEDKITEFVKAKGCQFIFFDHISMAITDETNKDERLALDRLVAAIKSLTVGIPDVETVEVEENGEKAYKTVQVVRQPTIFMVTHVNDNGQPRGSRAALQQSNLVISLQRDKLAKDYRKKNTTEVIVEENRRYGESGLACMLYYDKITASFTEIPIETDEGNDTPVMDGKFDYSEYNGNNKRG